MGSLKPQWRRINRIQFVAFGCALALAIIAIFIFKNLLLSFVVSVVAAYLLSPVVSYLEGRGINRLAAVLAVYFVLTIALVISITALFPLLANQFYSLRASLPHYLNGLTKLFDSFSTTLNAGSGGTIHVDIGNRARDWLTNSSTQLAGSLPGYLSDSITVLLLAPLLSFFLLKDGQSISRKALHIVPNSIFELTLSLQSQITAQIGQFIRARLLESAIVGLVVLIGLWIVGFPFPIVLALFAGVANVIPYLGPLAGAIPGCLIAFVNAGLGAKLFFVVLVYVAAQLIDIFFIIPLVVARVVDLHPITVILAVILGSKALGILGMLISIPVAAAIKVIVVSIYRHLTDDVTGPTLAP